VIDRGARRDSPFPIFLARARSDCHPRSEAKNHDRACVPHWSWSMTLIARSFPSGGYLHDRKQKTKADRAKPLDSSAGTISEIPLVMSGFV